MAIRAYREGLKAGDFALADRAALVLARVDASPGDAALQPLGVAARAGDVAGARRALAALRRGPLAPLVPGIAVWVAWAAHEDPFAPLAAAGTDPVARRVAAEARALLLIAVGRQDEGVAAVRAMSAVGGAADLRVDAARLLIAQHRRAVADTLIAGEDPVLDRLRAHPRGVKPSLGFGVARLLTMIGVDLAGGDVSPSVLALGRAALRADPANDRARLMLADELARGGAAGAALDVLAGVDGRGPYADVARTVRAGVLAQAGDPAAGLAAAAALATARDASPYDVQHYAEALIAAHRPGEAAAQYARVAQAEPARWDVWLQYAGALDDAGRWPDARAALERSVALGPDEPLALNYLGYARIEHGEAVAESEAMLAKAARLKPGDPSIADSLAWSWYRRGDVARALPLLESAAQIDPTNAVIAEHLGDVYWALGRRWEARYAWAASAVVADPPAKARLAARIDHGPDAP
ncbi:MAG: tetratricopeptide repeat protein [Janthinobacterium lividum]